MPITLVVASAVSRPVLLEVTYMHSSGVSRDINWKFEFVYASGGGVAQFNFLTSPIISNFGDISGLYSCLCRGFPTKYRQLYPYLLEKQKHRAFGFVCISTRQQFYLAALFIFQIYFTGVSNAFTILDRTTSSNVTIDAVVTGYVLSPCTCPLIITFETSNLLTLHWDSVIKMNISRRVRQFSATSVKVDGNFGVSHFLRAVFTKATVPSDFGNLKFRIAVDPLYTVSFTPRFKFIPFFNVIGSNPTILIVSPGIICSAASIFWGSGLSFALPLSVSNTFSVQCKDQWGNNRTLADAELFMFKLQLVSPRFFICSTKVHLFF